MTDKVFAYFVGGPMDLTKKAIESVDIPNPMYLLAPLRDRDFSWNKTSEMYDFIEMPDTLVYGIDHQMRDGTLIYTYVGIKL